MNTETKRKIEAKFDEKKALIKKQGKITYTLKTSSNRDLVQAVDNVERDRLKEETKKCNNIINAFKAIGGEFDRVASDKRAAEVSLFCKQHGYTSKSRVEVYQKGDMTLTVFQRKYDRTAELTWNDLIDEKAKENTEFDI
ncbi:MAG: hypothetical protein KJP21_05585 [Bacteroidia bacterium]|nr:hypothetical protein [Bacteroidia bacterium]